MGVSCIGCVSTLCDRPKHCLMTSSCLTRPSAHDNMERRRGEKGSAQQAELIRYLHRQRDSLSQEVLRLQVLLER
jgi:hypothetical protein